MGIFVKNSSQLSVGYHTVGDSYKYTGNTLILPSVLSRHQRHLVLTISHEL